MELFIYLWYYILIVDHIIRMIHRVNQIRLAKISASWPTTSGTIIISEIKNSRDGSDAQTYIPIVKFSYHVNGQSFTGDNISFGIGFSAFYLSPNEIIRKYPKQKKVEVFYHPSQPNQSVLEAGISKGIFSTFTYRNIFFIMGTLVFLIVFPFPMFVVISSFSIFFFIILLNFCLGLWLSF